MTRFAFHYFLLFAFLGTLNPYLQLLLTARGFTPLEVGLLLGLLAMAGVLGPVALGHLADRLGKRRPLLIACLLGTGALLLPLADSGNFYLSMALVAAVGFVCRAAIPLADALSSSELADPAHQYGQVRAVGSLGFVLTLLTIRAAGLVDEGSAWSMASLMLGAAVVAAASGLAIPDRHRAARERGPAPDGHRFTWAFAVFLFAASMHQLGMASHYSFFSIYLREELHMRQAAWVWAIGSAAEIPMVFFAGRIIRRFGLVAMLIVSMLAVSARLAVYAIFPTLWAALPVQLLHALVFGLFHPACIEFVRRSAPARRQGLAMALYTSLAVGLPSLVGSALGGWIIERWGYAWLYLSYAAAPLVGVACLAATARKIKTAIA